MPLIVKVVFLLVMFGDNCMRRLLDLSTDLDAKEKCFYFNSPKMVFHFL